MSFGRDLTSTYGIYTLGLCDHCSRLCHYRTFSPSGIQAKVSYDGSATCSTYNGNCAKQYKH